MGWDGMAGRYVLANLFSNIPFWRSRLTGCLFISQAPLRSFFALRASDFSSQLSFDVTVNTFAAAIDRTSRIERTLTKPTYPDTRHHEQQ